MVQSPDLHHPLLSAPKALLDWPAWCAWTAPVKNPLDLRRGLRRASVTAPDTWSPFSSARDYLLRTLRIAPPSIPLACGVGVLLSPPLVLVDFDDLIPEEGDAAPEWAEEFLGRVAQAGGYTEWSGSGTGAHAVLRTSSEFPALTRNRYARHGPKGSIGIEVYNKERFAALTGFAYYSGAREELNDPREGDAILTAFLADLGVAGAPILSAPILPIKVPKPNAAVRSAALALAEVPSIRAAFDDPQRAFAAWAVLRDKKSLDASASAWRFQLYTEASRASVWSPLPVFELFNPQAEPAHPNVGEWQEVSGYLKKKHRVYVDIQRAHALVNEEQRLLAIQLGEDLPKVREDRLPPKHEANVELAESWAQLGLVMKTTKNSSVPIPSTVNFIRCMSKHSHFSEFKIERNRLDGTTRVNREPIKDTFATRCLEPLRAIMDLNSDPPIMAVRDSIEVIADDQPYDPLQEYLRRLPKFDPDSEESLIDDWLERVGAQPSFDLRRFSRRILLGLVARALRPGGVKFDYVPVFEGPQGVGKSTLVSHLVGADFYAVLAGNLQSKDAFIVLRGKWGVELAEMSAFKKSDEETRKSFFSTVADTFRPPYGRASITVPRRCVLFGTTNDKQYLSDHTGARRYWPIFFPGELDLKWFLDHRDRLFAEAVYYFDLGEKFHDTMDEATAPERLDALQERLITPAWQGAIIDHLMSLPLPRLPTDEDAGFSGVLTTQYIPQVRNILDLPPDVQRMSDAQLASFLRRAGFMSHTIGYRANGQSRKTYGWLHPSLRRLTDEQLKAFLSFFPDLTGGVELLHWVSLREDHIGGAVRNIGGGIEVSE